VAEQRPAQKLIAALIILGFVRFVVLPAFDQRFGWSPVAPVVSVLANAMIGLSFLLFFLVMKSNSYAASTIQVEEDQPVVSTGPYAYVRHPMYSGYPQQQTFPDRAGMSQTCRFCCRSRLRSALSGDSVSAGRFSAEARNDGAAQPGSRAAFLLVLPC